TPRHCGTAVLPCWLQPMLEVTITVEKLTVSLDQAVAARARRAAELEGMTLSEWLSQTVDKAASLTKARAAMAEDKRIYGEPDEEDVRWVEEQLDAAGFGRPVPLAEIEQNRIALASLRGSPIG